MPPSRKYSTLAIIPARGGSKGVKRKNVLSLAGKPLLAWTIEAANSAELVDRTVVSTDDYEISQIAYSYGAEVVNRPKTLSGDDSKSEDALLHVLSDPRYSREFSPDLVVFLQCTSPLTLSTDIDGTIATLIREDADTSFAAIPFHFFIWRRDESNAAFGVNHDSTIRQLRQMRPPEYLEAGAVYVMKRNGFLHHEHRFFGKTVIYEMSPEHHCEIDTPIDFAIAAALIRRRNESSSQRGLQFHPKAIAFDFDGVFTDNRVYVDQNGIETVVCNRGDGHGLSRIRELGIKLAVFSTETNSVVAARCAKLQIDCFHGLTQKTPALREWLQRHDISPNETMYLGNDVNDADCLQLVGFPVVVNDAHPDIHDKAALVLHRPGGYGAVRELCDLVYNSISEVI